MAKKISEYFHLYLYVIIAYGLSWVFWIPAALVHRDLMSFPTLLLHTLGGFGPSAAGILMVYLTKDRAARKDFWLRTIDIKRLGGPMFLLILGVFPLHAAVSILIENLLGFSHPPFNTMALIAAQPLSLVGLFVMGWIGGPLAEELGWRGFALDELQKKWGVITVNLFLGLVWWAWHLPLFFIQGTTQNQMGVFTLPFWVFFLNIFPLTMLMTWFYNKTRRSIFSAILIHFCFNFTASMIYPYSDGGLIIQNALLWLIAGLFIAQSLRAPRQLPVLE